MTQLHCEQAHPWDVLVSIHLSHLAILSYRAGDPTAGPIRLCDKRRDYESPTVTLPLNEYGGNCIFVLETEQRTSVITVCDR